MRAGPVLLLVVGCSGAPLVPLGDDSGTPADSGHPGDDAGMMMPSDAGHDAGTLPFDAGTPDAGMKPDAGMPPMDAGHPPADAGMWMMTPPAMPVYSGGTCPAWPTSGPEVQYNDGGTVTTVTGFMTHGASREFKLVVPRNYDPSKAYPLFLAYHWLNASAGSIVTDGELPTATEQMDFIAVAPEHKKDASGNKVYQFNWPFVEGTLDPNSPAAAEEVGFMEDLIACVSQSHHIDPMRIHVFGASAGALWSVYVMTHDEGNRFASVLSISGGLAKDTVLGAFDMQYHALPDKYPALVLWGGPTDTFLVINFADSSMKYRDALVADDHFVVTCTHMSGHALPPIDHPADGGTFLHPLYQFLLDHPYGLPPQTSPWQQTGMPADMPTWCQIVTP
jgi:hypothetical protein